MLIEFFKTHIMVVWWVIGAVVFGWVLVHFVDLIANVKALERRVGELDDRVYRYRVSLQGLEGRLDRLALESMPKITKKEKKGKYKKKEQVTQDRDEVLMGSRRKFANLLIREK